MIRTPIIPIRIIPEYHDTDFDGTPNYRDCEIFNPNRQHIFKKEPIRKKELLSMTGDISVFGSDSYYKIKKLVKKHEKKSKGRFKSE